MNNRQQKLAEARKRYGKQFAPDIRVSRIKAPSPRLVELNDLSQFDPASYFKRLKAVA